MPMLDVILAANHIGLSKSTLDKLRVTGGGPTYIKIGSRVVYDVKDIDHWLEAKKIANTSQEPAASVH